MAHLSFNFGPCSPVQLHLPRLATTTAHRSWQRQAAHSAATCGHPPPAMGQLRELAGAVASTVPSNLVATTAARAPIVAATASRLAASRGLIPQPAARAAKPQPWQLPLQRRALIHTASRGATSRRQATAAASMRRAVAPLLDARPQQLQLQPCMHSYQRRSGNLMARLGTPPQGSGSNGSVHCASRQ